MIEWQTMDTAPRDGTDVLLYGKWAGEIRGPSNISSIDIGRWTDGTSDFSGNEWWNLSTGDGYACWIWPSHWAPINPPKPNQIPNINERGRE